MGIVERGTHWGEWKGPPDGQVQLKAPKKRKPWKPKPVAEKPGDSRWFTAREAAARLRVTAPTLYKLCRRGKIPGALQIGGDWRIDRQELENWIEASKTRFF